MDMIDGIGIGMGTENHFTPGEVAPVLARVKLLLNRTPVVGPFVATSGEVRLGLFALLEDGGCALVANLLTEDEHAGVTPADEGVVVRFKNPDGFQEDEDYAQPTQEQD